MNQRREGWKLVYDIHVFPKLSLTHFLTTLAFTGANVLIVIKHVTESIFLKYGTSLTIAIPVLEI